MQILLVRDILVRDDVGVVSFVSFGKLLVPVSIGDGKCHSEKEDDQDLLRQSL